MAKRIYVVNVPDTGKKYLVDAVSQSAAVRGVVHQMAISAHVATQGELIVLTKQGVAPLETE